MVSRFAAFVIWAAVAASIVFWALRLGVTPAAVPPHALTVSHAGAARGDLARLFGVDAAPAAAAVANVALPPADARFQLVGVVAPRSAAAQAEGLALIATDGRPARAYRVGSAVDGELVLLGVHSRGAQLGPRGQPPQVDLNLPLLPPPSTGVPGQPPRVAPVLPQRPPTLRLPPPAAPAPPVETMPVPQPNDADRIEPQPDPGDRPMYRGNRPPA